MRRYPRRLGLALALPSAVGGQLSRRQPKPQKTPKGLFPNHSEERAVDGRRLRPVAYRSGSGRAGGFERVRKVQRMLQRLRYASRPMDGLFAARTWGAVVRLQHGNGVVVDGAAGVRTLTALRHERAGETASPAAMKAGTCRGSGRSADTSSRRAAMAEGSGGAAKGEAGPAPAQAASDPAGRRPRSPESPTDAAGDEADAGAVIAFVLVLGRAVSPAAVVAFPRRRRSRRPRRVARLPYNVYLEADTDIAAIDRVRGFAVAAGCTEGGLAPEAGFLVDDPSHPVPVWIRSSETREQYRDQLVQHHGARDLGELILRDGLAAQRDTAVTA